jgi:hypothetical protein
MQASTADPCNPGTNGVSDCLIFAGAEFRLNGFRQRTVLPLDESNEAAGLPAINIPASVYDFIGDNGQVSDRLTMSAFTFTFQSDAEGHGLPAPPSDAVVVPMPLGERGLPFVFRVQSDAENRATSDRGLVQLGGPAGLRFPFTIPESSLGETVTMSFPKYVFDFVEPGTSMVGDRLTIDPWSFTFVSDTAEIPLSPPKPGDKFIFGEGAVMTIRVRSDSDVPEPSSLTLVVIGVAAAIGLSLKGRKIASDENPR